MHCLLCSLFGFGFVGVFLYAEYATAEQKRKGRGGEGLLTHPHMKHTPSTSLHSHTQATHTHTYICQMQKPRFKSPGKLDGRLVLHWPAKVFKNKLSWERLKARQRSRRRKKKDIPVRSFCCSRGLTRALAES